MGKTRRASFPNCQLPMMHQTSWYAPAGLHALCQVPCTSTHACIMTARDKPYDRNTHTQISWDAPAPLAIPQNSSGYSGPFSPGARSQPSPGGRYSGTDMRFSGAGGRAGVLGGSSGQFSSSRSAAAPIPDMQIPCDGKLISFIGLDGGCRGGGVHGFLAANCRWMLRKVAGV